MNAAINEKLIDTTVKPISAAPLRAACSMLSPDSRCRWMFSTTTIASSTTKPTATTSATSVRLLRLKPIRYIAAAVATKATTSTAATITVADSWRRNKPMTSTTKPIVTASVSSTSCSDERIVRVRSFNTSSSTPAGSKPRNSGSLASTRSAAATMFEPGCRRMISAMPGSPFCCACV